MSSTMSSIGLPQNAYQQQAFQSVSNDQTRLVRQQDQKPTETSVQPQGAETSQTLGTETQDSLSFFDQITSLLGEDGSTSSVPRGSVVDVTV